jgi:hypothetical protein
MIEIGGELAIYGVVHVELVRNGTVIAEETRHNVTCNTGVAAVNATISGSGSNYFTYIAIGTVGTAVAATDTALGGEVLRTAAGWVPTTTNTTNDTAQLTCAFTFLTSYAIKEIGLFGTAGLGTGVILGHLLIGPYSVNTGDVLNVVWNEVY